MAIFRLFHPVFTPELLRAICDIEPHPGERVTFVGYSDRIFGLGGDLDLVDECLATGDDRGLIEYAHLCCDAVLRIRSLPSTIAVVTGKCFGGAVEGVWNCSTAVLCRGAIVGVPEYRFGSWPGMGWTQVRERQPLPQDGSLVTVRRTTLLPEGRPRLEPRRLYSEAVQWADALFELGEFDRAALGEAKIAQQKARDEPVTSSPHLLAELGGAAS